MKTKAMIYRKPPRYRPVTAPRARSRRWLPATPAMQFHIGPWLYYVVWSNGQLRNWQGKEVDGLCCWSDYLIHINSIIEDPEKVLEVLIHELAHAWHEHFGVPGDSEGRANQAASFTRDVCAQLDRNGGIDALMQRRPF